MTLIPSTLPNSYTPTFTGSTPPAQKNADGSATYGRANQPWLLCAAQVNNNQTFADSSTTIIGFDTAAINTYKAVNGQQYKLRFNTETIGGHPFPYSLIILPQYGYYHVEWSLAVIIDGAVPSNQQFISYFVLNTTPKFYSTTSYDTIGTTDPGMVVHGGGYFLGNPDDTITIEGEVINPSQAYSATTINSAVATYIHLRYLGTAG